MSQQLSPGAQTIVDERVKETPYRLDEGDHERFSHFVEKEKLTEAMVMGTPVVALCGKVWVPSRDPERFPVCPECKEAWEGLKDERRTPHALQESFHANAAGHAELGRCLSEFMAGEDATAMCLPDERGNLRAVPEHIAALQAHP